MGVWDEQLQGVALAASAAVSDPDRWDEVLKRLCRRFGATAAAMHTPAPDSIGRRLLVQDNLPAGGVAEYVDYWAAQDPWFGAVAAKGIIVRSGTCEIGSDLCDWHDLEQTAFYNDFAGPQGVHGLLTLLVDDGSKPYEAPVTVISLYREFGKEEFSRDDAAAFKSVHPLLQTATHAHWALHAAAQHKRVALDALAAVPKPILVLGPDGRVLFSNPAAATLLARNGWIGTSKGRVVRLGQHGPVSIEATLAGVANGFAQSLPLWAPRLPGEHGFHAATARFAPLEDSNTLRLTWPTAACLLLVDELELDHRGVRLAAMVSRYGLSPSESRVLTLLLDGLSPQQISDQLGISIHTVRTHLRHLFDKTETRRQSALLKLFGDWRSGG